MYLYTQSLIFFYKEVDVFLVKKLVLDISCEADNLLASMVAH